MENKCVLSLERNEVRDLAVGYKKSWKKSFKPEWKAREPTKVEQLNNYLKSVEDERDDTETTKNAK